MKSVWVLLLMLFATSHMHVSAYRLPQHVSGKTVRWASKQIKYHINPIGAGLPRDTVRMAIESAFQSWSGAGVGLTFQFAGFTDVKNNATDRKNVIFWDTDGTFVTSRDALAQTFYQPDRSTAEIIDVDIGFAVRLDSKYKNGGKVCQWTHTINPRGIPLVWNVGRQYGRPTNYLVDIQATATHEIGHLLGLDHSEVVSASMSTVAITPEIFCSTTQRVLKQDDIAGIKTIYRSSVPVNQVPSAGFLISSTSSSATQGQTLNIAVPVGGSATVSFNGQPPRSSDPDPGGTIAGYEWRINGTIVSNLGSFNRPLVKGSHTVSLIVIDNGGLKSPAATGTIIVTETAPPLAAGFLMSGDGKSARNGQTLTINIPPGGSGSVNIDGRSPYSSDPDGIASCEWRFDGVLQSSTSCVTGANFLAGNHTVVLVAVDTQGARSAAVQGGVVITEIAPQPSLSQWMPINTPSPMPGDRLGHAMALEPTPRNLLLFGGTSATGGGYGDTWRFNTSTGQWAPLSPAQSPAARSVHAMAQAPCANRQAGCSTVLLFGGLAAGSVYTAETWVWDGENWSRPQLALEPSARIHTTLAFDAARNETVLFGGLGETMPNLNDTWIWNGSQWQQRFPANSPPPMQSYSMAYDALRAETILGGVPVGTPWFETWAWNGMTWLRKSSGFPPSLVKFGRIAYDGASGELVLYGGTTFFLDSPTDEVWTWNGAAWTPRIITTNPGRRIEHSMTTDSSGQIIMFGGTNGVSAQRYGGVWIWTRP